MSIKYRYNYKGLDYYLLEKLENYEDCPLFNAKTSKILDNKIEILDYILNSIKIKKENDLLIENIKKNYLKISKANYIISYDNNDYTYLIFLNRKHCIISEKNLAIFSENLKEKNELGLLIIDDKLKQEILELDQNLQSAVSVDLILELMEENEDMNKYINLIKEEVKKEDLDDFFFFDDFVYKIFMKAFIEVLNGNKLFKDKEFIKFLGEICEKENSDF